MNKDVKKAILKSFPLPNHATRFEVKEKNAKPIISLWLISQDLEEMIACLERAIKVQRNKNIDELIPKSLWEKMVISYGKIFSHSEDGFSKIEPIKYFKSKRSNSIHEHLIKVRNSYLAHRGYNDYEHSLMTLDIIQKDGKVRFQFAFPTAKQVGYFNKNHKSILRHLKLLETNVKKKLNEKVRKLEAFIINDLKNQKTSTCMLNSEVS